MGSEYTFAESKTWEVLRAVKDKSNYTRRLVRYRVWRAGENNEDWRIQIEDEDNDIKNFYLPAAVVDIMRREDVKKELKS